MLEHGSVSCLCIVSVFFFFFSKFGTTAVFFFLFLFKHNSVFRKRRDIACVLEVSVIPHWAKGHCKLNNNEQKKKGRRKKIEKSIFERIYHIESVFWETEKQRLEQIRPKIVH